MTSRRASSACSRPASCLSRRGRECCSAAGNVDAGLHSPILGKHFKLADLYSELPAIEIDETLSYVPVYCHFNTHDIQPVVRPPTPPILKELRAEFQDTCPLRSGRASKLLEPRSCSSHNSHRHSNLSNRSH